MATFDTEQVRQEDFSAAIQNSYAEYGVSSNARAIPDARDGLKPVQRRILWFMYRMGWDASHETVKSAEVVGTVMDVTEQWKARAKLENAFEEIKQRTEALRRSEAYLAEAQKLTPTGSWAVRVPQMEKAQRRPVKGPP